jgi:cysteinyl-tRNA synthetase
MDLIFPHHENEIAQSEGVYGPNFANYWVHNAFVRINQEKMSKSLGNFFTLKQVFEQFDPMVVRFYYLNHNYTNPLDFSFEGLEAAHKTYSRLCRIFGAVQASERRSSAVAQRMFTFLCDDLNTAGMFGVVFENIDTLKNEELAEVKGILSAILGLTLQQLPEKTVEITPAIQALLDKREAARAAKDWTAADAARDQLRDLGIDIKDKKL